MQIYCWALCQETLVAISSIQGGSLVYTLINLSKKMGERNLKVDSSDAKADVEIFLSENNTIHIHKTVDEKTELAQESRHLIGAVLAFLCAVCYTCSSVALQFLQVRFLSPSHGLGFGKGNVLLPCFLSFCPYPVGGGGCR